MFTDETVGRHVQRTIAYGGMKDLKLRLMLSTNHGLFVFCIKSIRTQYLIVETRCPHNFELPMVPQKKDCRIGRGQDGHYLPLQLQRLHR